MERGISINMTKHLNAASKSEMMDMHVAECGKTISSSRVFVIIQDIFQFDLESTAGLTANPRTVLDAYLNENEHNSNGPAIRALLNQTFGINLDALSALAGTGISIYSKNQWMLKQPQDLFVVHTGNGDRDVRIYTTDFFAEQTGSKELPAELINDLIEMGYCCDDGKETCSYSNTIDEAVPDAFKGKTMATVRKAIELI